MSEKHAQDLHQCCGGPGEALLPFNVGREQILAAITPLEQNQVTDVRAALGRVLAADVLSPINVPAYSNSAMDGYAVRYADLPRDGEARLPIAGSVLAGHPLKQPCPAGACVEIMTGAQVPAELDTVIIKEVCQRQGDYVSFPAQGIKAGQNRRHAGEDIAQGAVAVPAGTRLGAAELGLIASLGQAEVSVVRRPRVAYFSTGDEIRSLGQPLAEGQIYDSNRYTVTALLARLGIDVVDLGVIPDRPDAIENAFRQAQQQADVILSSGGVSLGEADFVTETLERLGEVAFWRLAIKPGRPLAFGKVGDAWFFGLPGNPVAVMITFLQFVRPALTKLAGETLKPEVMVTLPSAEAIRKKPGRTEFLRARIEVDAQGRAQVRSTGHQGSGILTSMSQADCLLVLEAEQGDVAAGDPVRVQPFEGLL
ncbi:gephyrin-like molybdotransferase Glp [Motiliproteus sp. SC1-56]|uniref:molybdopterin molybdotransferase MoeA n=1 Tax=Motiliproteus sp. SC1-56 TaxID=2799565 RepID=UPI001A8E7138|nr:gephyrin-like molybdotransferase Glp [Motiliproteus sp. SC1-56]